MPARIAGIQACKDAFGDIRVNLDSSNPCWNDTDESSCLNTTEKLRTAIGEPNA